MSEALRIEELEELDAVQLEPITNDAEADEALQKIAEAEDKVTRMKEWFERQLKMITESATKEIDNQTARLRNYFETVPHNKTKTQESYQLPSGKLVLKDQEPDYERNEPVMIKALKEKELTKFIKTKESVDWAALKRAGSSLDGVFFLDGIQIPGVKVVDRDRKFSISK